MGRFGISRLAGLVLPGGLAACSVIDVPISYASGVGMAQGATFALSNVHSPSNDLNRRFRRQIETELVRAGYRIRAESDYLLEFAVANRPTQIGVLLPESETKRPEAGTWRSRPVDPNAFTLCTGSLYRLMLVVSRRGTGEVVFRGSSDDDSCDKISDDRVKTMVASAVARLRERSTR